MTQQGDLGDQVAVVIPAYNESTVIAATVRTCHAIPGVDLVVVVDDGSTDDTQEVARAAGAVVVRHSMNRGKHSAMETGLKVVAMRNPANGRGRMLLYLDADLGESAISCLMLVEAVRQGADLAVADNEGEATSGGRGFVTRLARWAVSRATGWRCHQPLSGQRCLSPEAAENVLPFSYGWGVEVGMIIDLVTAGYAVIEVPTKMTHLKSNFPGWGHRLSQYKDVALAVGQHFFKRNRLKPSQYREAASRQQKHEIYQVLGLLEGKHD
ncbi:hypothetical protein BK816_00705 [Boudabousia tangfeifanii]|uniref:Glucosyl-3-phosphoglycerate synthase n=1 Tax=Boudabousia tangfeifanii TaxID=1912795 RepID=A0A1D9MI88_9ACTO|nr:glycosyltransferase [Boudabousia tangfeifanii]AOZ71996.1 hypothetical protein BK816_00705 [Boudabousia tangfeifanii]